jgi:hypothetical protein
MKKIISIVCCLFLFINLLTPDVYAKNKTKRNKVKIGYTVYNDEEIAYKLMYYRQLTKDYEIGIGGVHKDYEKKRDRNGVIVEFSIKF